MAWIDALARTVLSVLKFLLWSVAVLAGLAFVSLALALLLVWLVLNRLLGRTPQVTFSGRLQNLRQFEARFRSSAFKTGRVRPDAAPRTAEGDPPVARRIHPPGPVVDVQARDLPPDRSGS